MSYAGDERRLKSGAAYRRITKKKPRPPKPPPIDWGNTFSPKLNVDPGTFWANNPIPQGAPLVPTTKGEAVGGILASDPAYQAMLANLNAEGVSDRASRDAAIRRAIVMFGGVPNVPQGFLGGDTGSFNALMDPTTRGLAQKNTAAGLSILARLKQAAEDANRNTVNNLGARGTFRSGETGWRLKRNALDSDRANYDSVNKVLDYMAGVQAAYAQAERARKQREWELGQQVITRYDPPPTYDPPPPPPGPSPPPPPPGASKPKPPAKRKPPPRYNRKGFIGGK